MSRRNQQSAFTLIELLVVIAIIPILAGLLLPAMARAKEQGRSVICLNNQKQLHLAWQMYADDTDRFTRNWDYGSIIEPMGANWTAGGMSYEEEIQSRDLADATNSALLKDTTLSQLARYLGNSAVFKCPSDKSYAIRPVTGGPKVPRVRSYSMSQVVGESSRVPVGGIYYYFKQSDFSYTSPSQIFLFLDEHEDSINDGCFLIGNVSTRTYGFSDHPGTRHNRGANLLFADGHAEKHKWKDRRTLMPVTRVRLYGNPQSNSPDVAWVHDHSMFKKN